MFFIAIVVIWVAALLIVWALRRRGRIGEDLDRDLLSIGALGLLAIGFYWRPLLAGDVFIPADGGDLASFLYPIYRFAASSLRQGIIPLWNPHLYGGMPFIGDIQSGILYPVCWLLYLLTPDLTYRVLEGVVVFHIFLAGAAMYLALRFLRSRHVRGGRIRRLACMAGAVSFMFSDLFVVHFGNLNMIAVAAWLPLIFVLYHRALADRRPALAAWSGVAFAVATLAGHIQITLFIALVLGFRTLWEIGDRWRRRLGKETSAHALRLASPVGYLGLTGIVTLAMCAPALLPSIQHAAFTERASWSYNQAVQYSLAPGQFVSLLVPTLFGRGPAFHWGVWDRVEVGYLGTFPLMLAALAVMVRRDKGVRFMLGLAIFGFLVAMGLYAMPHGWLYQLVPGFGQMRAPARFVVMMNFGLAALAAFGLDALLRPMPRRARAGLATFWRFAPWMGGAAVVLLGGVIYHSLLMSQDKDPAIFMRLSVAANGVGLFAVFVGAGLALIGARRYGHIRPTALGALAIGLIFFDLSSTGAYIDLGTTDPTANYRQEPIVGFLKADQSLFRIDHRTGIDQQWQPDTAIVHGLDDIWGIVNPLAMSDVIRYWEGMGSRSTPLYDALNVKYVIARKDVELDWDRFTLAYDDDPDLNVYLNTRAMPRAWLVREVRIANDHEEAFRMIHAPDFDPATSVVLEGGVPLETQAGGISAVHTIEVEPNRVVVELESASEAVLVLSEAYYPGWKARVHGRAVPVLRANYWMRGVMVPAGMSRVELVYSPTSWWLGLGLCGITVVGLLGWAVWRRRR